MFPREKIRAVTSREGTMFSARNSIATAMIVALISTSGMALAGSQTVTQELRDISDAALTVAKPAQDFTDADIKVPKGFDLRGIDTCTGLPLEPPTCPLRKYIVRIDVHNEGMQPHSGGIDEPWEAVNDVRLSEWLSDYINNIGRFRVVSRYASSPLRPDAVLRVSAKKTAQYTYKGTYGEAVYGLTLSSTFLDPVTGEMRQNPRIPQLLVQSTPQEYIIVNGRIVVGMNFADKGNVEAEFQRLSARSFQGVVNTLLNEMPSTAQVIAIRGSRIRLDRGIESGILNEETMVVIQEIGSVLEPLAVAEVIPGQGSSHGTIHRWKQNPAAAQIRRHSEGTGLDTLGSNIFAISVGPPASYKY